MQHKGEKSYLLFEEPGLFQELLEPYLNNTYPIKTGQKTVREETKLVNRPKEGKGGK